MKEITCIRSIALKMPNVLAFKYYNFRQIAQHERVPLKISTCNSFNTKTRLSLVLLLCSVWLYLLQHLEQATKDYGRLSGL